MDDTQRVGPEKDPKLNVNPGILSFKGNIA